MKTWTVLMLAVATVLPAAAYSQTAAQPPLQPAQADAPAMTDGEVRRIDKEAKKITLRHGPIQNLNMPPMTMVFQVKDPALLDKVNVGDKVKFSAEKITGGYALTNLEAAK
jgi:Cu(I)/Ag(I) efflux system periplasmic protein CusF